MSENIDIKTLNGYGTTLAAVINFPPDFDASKSTRRSSSPTRAAV